MAEYVTLEKKMYDTILTITTIHQDFYKAVMGTARIDDQRSWTAMLDVNVSYTWSVDYGILAGKLKGQHRQYLVTTG